MNQNRRHPALSVILVTPDNYITIRKTVTCLRKQTARSKLELVIVCTSLENLNVNETELEDLLTFKIVEVGEIQSRGHANAVGVHNAAAPVIAFAEDHCYPHKTWAEALIEAHRQPWAAVGPVVRNANPRTRVSQADMLIGYAPWAEPAAAGCVDFLPGHNSSYKRSVLLAYGEELELFLEAECIMHWDMHEKGHQLYLEPEAKTAHVNFSKLTSMLRANLLNGRLFASIRNKKMSGFARLFYVLASPLIPFVRVGKICKETLKPGRSGIGFGVASILFLGLLFDAFGQFVGYAFGQGGISKVFLSYEFHRSQHLIKKENTLAT